MSRNHSKLSQWISLTICILLMTGQASSVSAPGTSSRPILYDSEAALYTQEKYFAASASSTTAWTPDSVVYPSSPDYTVGSGATYTTIQQAVNAAVNSGSTSRKYILINAGTYRETVYIPNSNTPIMIYGSGNAEDTVITLSLSASTTGSQYKSTVGSYYSSGDPAYSMYNNCASRSTIGTGCSAVFWSQSPDLQIYGLTIQNEATDAQAVALSINGDRSTVKNVRLLGHQDTFLAGTDSVRIYVYSSYIVGDVDFVFGRGRAVFDNTQFRVTSDRETSSAYVLAPDTKAADSYGFLVKNSKFTSTTTWHSSGKAQLGRSWDEGATSGYVAGTTPNGQAVVRDSTIDGGFNLSSPWASAATTGRTYSGNANSNRNLDDSAYNRLWEYNNSQS